MVRFRLLDLVPENVRGLYLDCEIHLEWQVDAHDEIEQAYCDDLVCDWMVPR